MKPFDKNKLSNNNSLLDINDNLKRIISILLFVKITFSRVTEESQTTEKTRLSLCEEMNAYW